MTVYPNNALPFSSSAKFYGTQQPTIYPNSIRIVQEEFRHDMVVLDFWADDVNSDSYQSGMPVSISYGRRGLHRSFYGYVNHTSRTNNALSGTDLMGRNSTTVYCVGASWPMKQRGTQSWTGYTATQVIKEIADLFNLDADIIDDTTVWPVLHMTGQTFWQFCCGLAERIGYTFYVSGMRLVFKPRRTDPTNIRGNVTWYDYRADPASLSIFVPTLGSTSPEGGELATRQLAGIDPRTGNAIFAQQSGSPQSSILGSLIDAPVFTRTRHDSVLSLAEANAKMSGAGSHNQLYLAAQAHGAGNSLVSQGSLVYVANANGSQNGMWFVKKADHLLTATNYTMDLELGRDSLGAAQYIAGSSVPENLPSASLSSNVWRAVVAA